MVCWWQAVAGDGGGGLRADAGGRAAAAVVQLLQGTRAAAEMLAAIGVVAGDERWWADDGDEPSIGLLDPRIIGTVSVAAEGGWTGGRGGYGDRRQWWWSAEVLATAWLAATVDLSE